MALSRFFKLWRPGKGLHPLIAQNHGFFNSFDKEQELDELEFVVIDTELTGLHKTKDEIVAIGAVRIKNLRIQAGQSFYALVKPQLAKLQSSSTLIHRITPQELLRAQDISEVLPSFLKFCGSAYLVGHYVRLDLEFLNAATRIYMGGVLKTPYLCTMRLAMAFKEFEHGHYYDHANLQTSYNLAALTRQFALPQFAAHNALQDSLQTAYLFLYLAKKLRKFGVKTLGDYLAAGRQWKIIL